ncbi:AAA family ATPase [Nonomuraea sp. NPDC059194]|uniref:AAA family ATPase n=1 Tax=Nonomuraea sp. NPDC059194 TaxID=3346764 RepID=UPI0036928D14
MSTSPTHATLHDQIRARLAASDLNAEAGQLILAALGEPPRPLSSAPSGIYLGAIGVSGFRGIGRSARLPLTPANGLTIVTGRNGSGKSSFAEAVEMALTGENSRWKDKSQIWTSSFANLHTGTPPEIEVELAISGDGGPSLVHRCWTGPKVTDSAATVTRPGHGPAPLSELGLDQALADYRPFLPYAELGDALDKPSEIYDKISTVLGLGLLADACKRLREQVLAWEKTAKTARQALPVLLVQVRASGDPRARAVLDELGKRDPDLSVIEALVSGDRRGEDESLRSSRRLAELTGPDIEAVRQAAERLQAARGDAERVAGTAAEDARGRADLLELALAQHRRHPDDPACPVCEAPERLDDAWAARAAREIARLRAEATAAESARRELHLATESAARLVTDPPAWVPAPLAEVWRAWAACRSLEDPSRFVVSATRLAEACRRAKEDAVKRLADQDSQWYDVVSAVAVWCRDARESMAATARLVPAKKADEWLRAVHDGLRAERMEAQGQDARGYWQIMRQQSNVMLGRIRLTGRGGARKAELDVTVDDVPGAALGVMSQGELHALALSLFLPRAMMPDSPFRFLVIDDPVQSMDPAKVDGLAELLDVVAQHRQVVVFTHDSRLPEAVRRMRLPATILEIVRKERSELDVVASDDPIDRALKDARAIAAHPRLPAEVGQAVLPGLCRIALDAAFAEVARRRLLTEGLGHDEVEKRIAEARPTGQIAALALGVTAQREVTGWLNQHIGAWAGDVFIACNKGSHDPEQFHVRFRGDGKDPIEYVTKLTRRLRQVH